MAQADNTVIITGRVVKGPIVSYVNGDTAKMRVKYQVKVETRKKDNMQTFTPWVRTLGNQAQKDFDNIKTGDIVTVQGRIVTRNETKKRFLVPDPDRDGCLIEIDPEDDDLDTEKYDVDNAYVFNDQKMVTEIQGDDVRYFSRSIADLSEEDLKKLVGEKTLLKVLEIKSKNDAARANYEEQQKIRLAKKEDDD